MRNYPILAMVVAILCGCSGTNLIQSFELLPGQTPTLNRDVIFVINGVGRCRTLTIDWGDGFPLERWDHVDLTAHSTARHSYSGWTGGKTVTVDAVSGCQGRARTRFRIEPSASTFVLPRGPTGNNDTCILWGAELAPNSLVKIVSPVPPVVDFGCLAGGCVYGVDGKPGSTAAAPFPFPGFREFSLVLRVGSQLFQGGSNSQTTVPIRGRLELCQNDNTPDNNTGSWQIELTVDQLGQ